VFNNTLLMKANSHSIWPEQRVWRVIWEELCRHPSQQRMDSPTACAGCATPTADESNHSAYTTLA